MAGPEISVVIKARNEEHNIVECLDSLKNFASEVVIVDDGSTDKTVSIASARGAKIITGVNKSGLLDSLDKQGFECASGEWILRMDADERMTESLAKKLKEIAAGGGVNGVRFARKNMMFGGWARHGGWFKNDQLRFFKSDAWNRNWDCTPHSHPEVAAPIIELPANENFATIHLDYENIPEFVERTFHRYSRMEAKALYRKGVRFSVIALIYNPIKKFAGRLVIRQGWRDGPRGIILAGLLGIHEFLIQANLWDIERENSKS